MNRLVPFALAAFAALTAPVQAAGGASASAPAATSTGKGPRVTVAPVKRAEIVERLTVTGTLVPRDEILISPEIDGLQVVELRAEEGDRVEKGQVLARLRRDTLDALLAQNAATLARAEAGVLQAQSQIAQAEAALTQARQALQRTSDLRQSGFSTKALFDQLTNDEKAAAARLRSATDGLAAAQADRAATEAMRRELSIRLAATDVKAPAAGVISRRSARLGGTAGVAAPEPLFRLIADGEIELEAEVSELRINGVNVGAPAIVTAGERTATGSVRLVSTEIDRLTRLGRLRIAIGNETGMRVGAFARGTVETRKANGLVVPLSALLYGEGKSLIQVVKGDRIETRTVTTGIIADGRAEIVSGLAEGEVIAVKAGAFLRDGDQITPVEAN